MTIPNCRNLTKKLGKIKKLKISVNLETGSYSFYEEKSICCVAFSLILVRIF